MHANTHGHKVSNVQVWVDGNKKKSTLKIALLTMLLVFCEAHLYAQNTIRLENSEIEKVRIYQNGAFVSRSVKATLNPGLNEVVFDGLSPYINPNSVTVKGMGDATIIGVNFQQNYLKDQKKSPEINKLETERDSFNIKLRYIQNKIASTNEGIAVLQANKSIGGNNK
jgi:hypothetical protein